ncbi:hypothetical protein [Caulobacter vibrioides]|jgi:hypothetical protein|uniref:hypothetical protein n=1 Tax=Caulobacter vibrioides TaxID=155892 RepID=UPI0015E7340C|nr:hypothetical protein [Caulobacter vibrioides]
MTEDAIREIFKRHGYILRGWPGLRSLEEDPDFADGPDLSAAYHELNSRLR